MSATVESSFSGLSVPALALTGGGTAIAEISGEVREISAPDARAILNEGNIIVCHASWLIRRLGARPRLPCYDLLELFAFVHPGRICLPAPAGIARIMKMPIPENAQQAALIIARAAADLLRSLSQIKSPEQEQLRNLATFLTRQGWRWGAAVLSILGESERKLRPMAGLEVWRKLPEWEDEPAAGPQGQEPVAGAEAQARLIALVGAAGSLRRQQQDFTVAASGAFAPRERAGSPNIVLAEAGTGTGKTLGYLAPVSIWAEKNGPSVWVSTFTRNLQRQILQESQKLTRRAGRPLTTVLRKGRENYLCLLNFEAAVKHSTMGGGQRAIALALLSRWVAATGDGDISGEGFPAFLGPELRPRELTDRRGECIYAACPHYRKCFIEHSIRSARNADIVIANHALVMAHAARNAPRTNDSEKDVPVGPAHYVFDEGHHIFDAADSAFAALLSGAEMAELRHWVRGPEGKHSRSRGLEERLRDLVTGDEAANEMRNALSASAALAGDGWLSRIRNGMARGAGEEFLVEVFRHVLARSTDNASPYGIEADARPAGTELQDRARELDIALARLAAPMKRLAGHLRHRLDDEAAKLEPPLRRRIEAAVRGLERRSQLIIPAWRDILASLGQDPPEDSPFAAWFEIRREDGRDMDVGLHRRWIDPTIPFAEFVLKHAHGVLITSATLRDSGDTAPESGWRAAEVRVGAHHLPEPPQRAVFDSPFDWPRQARLFVVRDIPRGDRAQLAAAFRELFLCAGGGALGLFTAVTTMKDVHRRIADSLATAGLMLYAQHVDALDTATLVDLFRADENACLIGTDALRDGIDVPGRSLRLCVFDKVPWPKPSILHKARRARFGKDYDDVIARLRLKQAFGRLIRSETDRGVFVILDGACPSRLLSGLPGQIPAIRCGLKQAVEETRRFLGAHTQLA